MKSLEEATRNFIINEQKDAISCDKIDSIGDNICNVVEKKYHNDNNETISIARYYVMLFEKEDKTTYQPAIIVDPVVMDRINYENITDSALVAVIGEKTYYFDIRTVRNYTIQRLPEDGFLPLHYAKIKDIFENVRPKVRNQVVNS